MGRIPAGLLLVPVWVSMVAGIVAFSILGDWKAAVLYAARRSGKRERLS